MERVLDLICGKCAQELGISLEDRIEIALSRLSGNEYFCSICKSVHSINHKPRVTVLSPSIELPILEVKEVLGTTRNKVEVSEILLF